MHTVKNRRIPGHFLVALTFTLAIAAAGVAAAKVLRPAASLAPIPSASQMMDARYNAWGFGDGLVYKNGKTAGHMSPLLFSTSKVHQRANGCKWCAWRGSGFGATNTLARGATRAHATRPAAMVLASFTPTMAYTGRSSAIAAPTDSSAGTENVSMQWRPNSFSIAGSRVWSKVIKFTSTGIDVRVPLN
jgi:hypothetical protein